MLLDASTPTTRPLGTRRAISRVILPSPHPTSSTHSEPVSSRACKTSAAMACCKLEHSEYNFAFHSVMEAFPRSPLNRGVSEHCPATINGDVFDISPCFKFSGGSLFWKLAPTRRGCPPYELGHNC